jgi:hypothetical protein
VDIINIIIPKSLGIPLSELAYNRLYFDFVIPWPGTLSRLRQQLRETTPDSCLVSVVAAVAYANFHGRCNSSGAKSASRVHYGQALQRLATTMTSAVEMQRDEILMVIWLLGMYEVGLYQMIVFSDSSFQNRSELIQYPLDAYFE